MKIFSGTSNKPLAEKIAKKLGLSLSPLEVFIFPDGEKRIRILDKVLDEDVYVVQSTASPTDANYMELFFIIDGLKRSGAKSITAIIPYFGYQRQDRQFREGEAVSVKVIAEILEKLGISKLITVDLHSIKIEEAFSIPVVHLSALSIFAKFIQHLLKIPKPTLRVANIPSSAVSNTPWGKGAGFIKESFDKNSATLVSPDMGGIRRIKILSEMLNNMPYAVIEKNRDLNSGKVSADKIAGHVGRKAIIVDDMISSGGTIVTAAELLRKNGAKDLVVLVTHPVLSEKAPKILQESGVESVYVTDTIFVPEEKRFPKLKILSVSEMIAVSLS